MQNINIVFEGDKFPFTYTMNEKINRLPAEMPLNK